jgi:hypothetical protein
MNSQRLSLQDLNASLTTDIDLFICCASYESRCRAIADQLPRERIRCAIVAETEHAKRYLSENGKYLRAHFGDRARPADIDTTDPLTTADALWHAMRDQISRQAITILIDVTTFTHESLLILVRLITLHIRPDSKVLFAYTSAAEYSAGDKDAEKWLSKGVGEVRSVLGYAGEIRPSRRQHLIVLVGFEHERAAELIRVYEPSVISLGHGRPGTATSEKHEIANRHFHNLVTATASTYGEVRRFEFSCSDPLDAQVSIEKQMHGLRGLNTIIAPMNTKLSTLGVVLAAKKDEAIQLCYAPANQYNYKAYSIPGEDCYLLHIPELFSSSSSRYAEDHAD